ALVGFTWWVGRMPNDALALAPWQWFLISLAVILPASEWTVTGSHWFIERLRKPIPLLRYDLSQGVPDAAKTVVVVPIIWSSAEEVVEMTERLELHYLANPDPNIEYALLSDLPDASEESLPEDQQITDAAVAA